MRYDELRTEYLLFKEGNYMLSLRFGEVIFSNKEKELEHWRDSSAEELYDIIIKEMNTRPSAKKELLKQQIQDSILYKTFKKLIKQYSEDK